MKESSALMSLFSVYNLGLKKMQLRIQFILYIRTSKGSDIFN